MRFLKNWVVLVVVSVVVLAGGIWWWHSRGGEKLSFTTAEVKRGDVTATISAAGTIEPLEVVDIGAQVDGRISAFGTDTEGKTVDYGSTVAEGSLLAKIDDSVYAADLSVSKAGLLSAQANLEQMNAKLAQAEAEWKRAQDLYASKLTAQVDYETDKANYEIARANVSVANSGVEQAKADLEKAQRNLDFCTINSPVSGVIIDRRVNEGQTVVSSLSAPSLFLIARDLTKMQIWVSVNEADVGRIKTGMPVDFTVDAFPNRDFKGIVGRVRLNAQMTQNVVLYTVEINIENPDKLLLPYLTANVRFLADREANALMVPNAALRWSPTSLAEVAPEARKDLVDPPGEVHVATPPAEKNSDKKNSKRTLWVKSGDFVQPVEVTTGISDGVNTAVTSSDLHESDEVVTGDIVGGPSNVSNPFLPKIMRR
ncbi:MAG TPA: efflux RND transporter periplasmic adaptor subunit [Verrucomicrobiae bacterium]|nr:efflux RND transporter periplasmic adaptor subunit [Verrucomicrobiae bacterium]